MSSPAAPLGDEVWVRITVTKKSVRSASVVRTLDRFQLGGTRSFGYP